MVPLRDALEGAASGDHVRRLADRRRAGRQAEAAPDGDGEHRPIRAEKAGIGRGNLPATARASAGRA